MSDSESADDAQLDLEGISEVFELFRSLSLEPLLDIMAKEIQEDVELDPFELVASNIVGIILGLMGMLYRTEPGFFNAEAYKESQHEHSSSSPIPTSDSPNSGKRFWPFKQSQTFLQSTTLSPVLDPEAEDLVRTWSWLLLACLRIVNDTVAAHTLSEDTAKADHQRPPLFWLLFSGHRVLQTLQESIEDDGRPSPLEKWNTEPLSQWVADTLGLFKRHGLMDDEQGLPKEPEHPNPSMNVRAYYRLEPGDKALTLPQSQKINTLLQLLPPGMIHRSKHGAPFCDLTQFSLWHNYGFPSVQENAIGRLQELYLFRGEKAPFHHEFIIAGFGHDGQEVTNWIRVERGAQLQDGISGSMSGFQLSGPLLSGVEARETISFSTSKADLSITAKELAKVAFPAPTTLPIFFRNWLHQVQTTGWSNLKYQLFTTNCRWYARRSFINILQWCYVGHIPAIAMWKGTVTSLEALHGKLKAERFGGSKLDDLRAKGLDHRILLAIAMSEQNSTPLSRAVLDPFLESLPTMTLDPDERTILTADLLAKRSYLIAGKDLPQALNDAERAVNLLRALPKETHTRDDYLLWALNAFANALHLDGRFAEAIPVLQESLGLQEPFGSHDNRLYQLGLNYQGLGQLEEAVTAFRESADTLGRGDRGESWSFRRNKQIESLVMLAKTLESLGRGKQVISVHEEIVSIRRDLTVKDENGDKLLVLALIDLATCAISAEEYTVSLKASIEAVQICGADPVDVRLLSKSLTLNARALYGLDDVTSAIQVLSAAIEMEPSAVNDAAYAFERGQWLKTRSTYVLESSKVLDGVDNIEALIPIFESAHDLAPEDPHIASRLEKMYSTRASVHKDLEDAADAFRQAADIARPGVDAEADVPWNSFAELISFLEARRVVLVEINRPEEARVCAQEYIDRLRLRRNSSVSSRLISEDLGSALILQSKLIVGLGAIDEALSLANEAAEICRQLGDAEYQAALFLRLEVEAANANPRRVIVTAKHCLEWQESGHPDRLAHRSEILLIYAYALRGLGRHADAAEKMEESLALFRGQEDFTSLIPRVSLAHLLDLLSEYYLDAGLFEQALVAANDAAEHNWTLYEEGVICGIAYCETMVLKARILCSLNEHKESRRILDEELRVLRTVLEDTAMGDILEFSGLHFYKALMFTAVKRIDALESAWQHLVADHLASSFKPRQAITSTDIGKGEANLKSVFKPGQSCGSASILILISVLTFAPLLCILSSSSIMGGITNGGYLSMTHINNENNTRKRLQDGNERSDAGVVEDYDTTGLCSIVGVFESP
ncbi:hypothetical protein DL93DRAFT_2158790 [Clavulina sp. PMI_390]|nr:hypothetical protein DL93DRAFT_2158790 [Clavulina sp. PMI_390]